MALKESSAARVAQRDIGGTCRVVHIVGREFDLESFVQVLQRRVQLVPSLHTADNIAGLQHRVMHGGSQDGARETL